MVTTQIKRSLIMVLIAVFASVLPAFAVTSQNYSLVSGYIDGGGGSRSSTGYVMTEDVLGIGVEGNSASAQYAMLGGSVAATADLDAPDTILIAQPSNPSNNTLPTFSFSSNEVCTFECKVDNGSFSACTNPVTLSSLSDGSHTFSVRAIDFAGNIDPTPAAYTWTIDTSRPNLTLSTPTNGAITNAATITVAGAVTDNTGLQGLQISGATVAINSDNTFSYLMTLTTGTNLITAVATDLAGNQTMDVRDVILDQAAPSLTMSTLPNGAYTNNRDLNVSGIVRDNISLQSLVISGSTVTVRPDHAFSYLVTLSNGPNSITTTATDLVGNKTEDNRTINLDQTAPNLWITAPADNSATNQLVSTVTGTVDEMSTVMVKLNNDTPLNASMTGNSFTASVNLASGMNTMDITVTDLAGHTSSGKRTVIYDPVAPSVAITSPAYDISTGQQIITISGTVADALTPVAATMTFDGTASDLALVSGAFSQTVTFETEGNHTIIVTATDQAGNSASAQRNIKLDSGPLTSNVAASPDPVPVNTAITLTATVDDSLREGLTITSAEYAIDGAGYLLMYALDGVFDSVREDVTASIPAFAASGVYALCVRGWDMRNAGRAECIFLPVYDPSEGYVTGHGQITSPAGAYTLNPDLIGKATFGFVSKYVKGAKIPSGRTEFQFKIANLSFHSDSYEWLVVSGSRAQYKGTGTINDTGSYGFMLTAIDGDLSGGGGIDKFRIKVWDKVSNAIIYDSQPGSADTADPLTPVEGGSIVIHKK